MNPVESNNAFQIGWLTGQLLKAGLRVGPVMKDGVYTDTVEWLVTDANGRYVSVHLTINPDVPQ